MAENKIGPNIGAGAGIFAKRVQKSLNRAQEKVSNLSFTQKCRTGHGKMGRSEERRVGKECLRLCRSRWSPYH